jgi:GAF domain-containing protein
MDERLAAAATVGALPSQAAIGELLQSTVDVARAIFSAQAATIFLLDPESEEVVFEAVSGAGSSLVGQRLPANTGIAGWVLAAAQPLVIEDLSQDPRFARGVAENLGYVPHGLMAVPLLRGGRVLGVLEVLDRPQRSEFSLDEIELLAMFANQAAIALDLLQRTRRASDVMEGTDEAAVVARLASTLLAAHEDRREDALVLLGLLEQFLRK